MLIGIISDIHDHLDNLAKACSYLVAHEIDTVLFLGDFCSPIPARQLGGFPGTVHCIFGNGDGDRFTIRKLSETDFRNLIVHGEYAELTLGDRSIAITHYPFYARALARTGDYDAVFSGHTHERHEERFGKTLWVNPGDVMGWQQRASCAIYDTTDNTASFIDL